MTSPFGMSRMQRWSSVAVAARCATSSIRIVGRCFSVGSRICIHRGLRRAGASRHRLRRVVAHGAVRVRHRSRITRRAIGGRHRVGRARRCGGCRARRHLPWAWRRRGRRGRGLGLHTGKCQSECQGGQCAGHSAHAVAPEVVGWCPACESVDAVSRHGKGRAAASQHGGLPYRHAFYSPRPGTRAMSHIVVPVMRSTGAI